MTIDKNAIEHVMEARAKGIILSTEVHGLEMPGYFSAAGDAARESAVILPLLALILAAFPLSFSAALKLLLIFAFGWLLWKTGRSAWLGWFRLERLHRVLEQERWEIEHHRPQEKEELRVLYAAKGFEGKLLDDVIDVLMADNDRLLRVMVEEELGLSIASHEHPLKQGLGAAFGVIAGSAICLLSWALWPFYGIFFGSFLVITGATLHTAKSAQNNAIAAIVWNLGLAAAAFASVYFFLEFFKFLE